jgi:hypothetical protein
LPSLVEGRLGAPVFLCSIRREGLSKYVVDVVSVSGVGSSDLELYFENCIRKNVFQWYGWSHRRFMSVNSSMYS